MADVQPENGTAPIAYALLEALSRDRKMGLHARVTVWVLRNTYGRRVHGQGPRRKTCAFSWQKIAEQIGYEDHRSRISRVGRELIATGRLFVDARGHIGIQKDYEKWAEGPGPVTPRAKVARASLGQRKVASGPVTGPLRVAYKERAREVVAVQSEPVSLTRAPSSGPGAGKLPGGMIDTMRARADLGHADFPPDAHPGWAREDFRRREEYMAEWRMGVQAAENVKRRADFERRAKEQDEAARRALTPEQMKAELARLRKERPWPTR